MLQVGPADPSEMEQVLRLAHDTLGAEPEWMAHRQAMDACLVAKDAMTREVVGFAVARREPCCEAHLLALAVDRAHRGEGIGAALLRYTQDVMYRAGAKHIHLEVRPDNDHAQAFYAHHGYAPAGVQSHAYEDGADAIVWERPL